MDPPFGWRLASGMVLVVLNQPAEPVHASVQSLSATPQDREDNGDELVILSFARMPCLDERY